MVRERIFDIDQMLNNIDPDQKATIQKLRGLIKTTVPTAVELVKRGRITYKLNEKDFVWINHYKEHVDLEFFMGASLDSRWLKRRGTAEQQEKIRHMEVKDADKLASEITRLLKQAASIGFEHCPAP